MAENIKNISIVEIFEELFKGSDAALSKYEKVRRVQYEMELFRDYNLNPIEIPRDVKIYFSRAFLKGVKIEDASQFELEEAYTRLNYAVNTGCHGRCMKLLKSLDEAYSELGIENKIDYEKFLDYMTFYYFVPDDCDGNACVEPAGFDVRIFKNTENRKKFWTETKRLLSNGKILSLANIYKLVRYKEKAKLLESQAKTILLKD